MLLADAAQAIGGKLYILGGVPALSKKIGEPPREEKAFSNGGLVPNGGVLKYAAAATDSAPTADA